MSDASHATSSAMNDSGIQFSIVIATRNRGALLRRALRSVIQQTGVRLEVVVVDDGSSSEHAELVSHAVDEAGEVARRLCLPARSAGHGPAFARNSGVAICKGLFIGFLDDDDEWTDQGHLARCLASMATTGPPIEAIFGDQYALHPDGSEHSGALWLRGIERRLKGLPDAQGAQEADVVSLLSKGGMCHLNTLVMRRKLFEAIGGFDERLRYEEDRDLCLRVIDAAGRMLYQPTRIGRHYIPDPNLRSSVTSAMNDLDKRLAQMLLLEKAQFSSRHLACKQYARRSKGQILKHMALQLASAGRHRDAHAYRLQALVADFSARWLIYTVLGVVFLIGEVL